MDTIPEEQVVGRAREGDPDAFGELVRRYRSQAYGWARSMARDDFLAEDIVQDALIRAFMKMGSLVETNRFKHWLHRIVQNQANMKLRRGGPFGKEKPFSSYTGGQADKDAESMGPEEWRDLDRILSHLSKSAERRESLSGDPVAALLRKETFEGILEMLHCLSSRERTMFESFFFRQLSPAEIAHLYGTSTANVYNHLANSRKKLQKERLRVQMSLYIEKRRKKGLPKAKTLGPPPN
jgi:RNA polymerase sigma factor (sigma-70 family)